MRLAAYVLAIPKRKKELEATLARWAESDWPEKPTVIMQAPGVPTEKLSDRWKATAQNSYNLLVQAANDGADYILFTEDDIGVNRHLHHNLTHWAPIHWGSLHAASLYTPNVVESPYSPVLEDSDAYPEKAAIVSRKLAYRFHRPMNGPVPHGCMWGSQAYVFSLAHVKNLLRYWYTLRTKQGGQDERVMRIGHNLKVPMFYHLPDLVEHHHPDIGSEFNTVYHRSADFDIDWKAGPLPRFQYPHQINGNLTEGESLLLWESAVDRRVLEMGVGYGRKTGVLLQATNHVTSIDRFLRQTMSQVHDRVSVYGRSNYIQTDNWCCDPLLDLDVYDLIVIDGEKRFQAVKDNIEYAKQFLSQQALIALYGYRNGNEVALAVDAAAYKYGWRLKERAESLIVFETVNA